VNTVHLIQAYTGSSAGLVFRLRQRSANQALAHRIQKQQQNGSAPSNGSQPSR
jgi:hypothetical protein